MPPCDTTVSCGGMSAGGLLFTSVLLLFGATRLVVTGFGVELRVGGTVGEGLGLVVTGFGVELRVGGFCG